MTSEPPAPLRHLVISGIGLLTPLGMSGWSTLRSLLEGRTVADRLAELPEDVDPVSLAKATASVACAAHAPTDPAIVLAERAAREAMSDAGIEPNSAQARETVCVLASSKGAIMSILERRHGSRRHEALVLSPHGYLAATLRDRLGFGGVMAPVAACATSLVALDLAARMVDRGDAKRALVVAVESAMHPIFIHSYQRLGALAPVRPVNAHRALPLDQSRCGFTVCECAAAVMVERADQATSPRPWAALHRTAVVTEPHDLVRAPERFTSLQRAAAVVTHDLDDIALVQPHATATQDNDERELRALQDALGSRGQDVPVYASKGAIGHGLGAAGLVNIALGCLCARARSLPPMPWIENAINSPFAIQRAGGRLGDGAHVCVAAGFGGHVGAVSLMPFASTVARGHRDAQ